EGHGFDRAALNRPSPMVHRQSPPADVSPVTVTVASGFRSHLLRVLSCTLLWTSVAAAQQPPENNGPPAPALPQSLSRDDQGRATIRAVRVTTPMRIDGRLDEA